MNLWFQEVETRLEESKLRMLAVLLGDILGRSSWFLLGLLGTWWTEVRGTRPLVEGNAFVLFLLPR